MLPKDCGRKGQDQKQQWLEKNSVSRGGNLERDQADRGGGLLMMAGWIKEEEKRR